MFNHFQDDDPALRLAFCFAVISWADYTPTRAFCCFLVQPEWLRSIKDQAKGRIWRTGFAQKSVKTYAFRCILSDFDAKEIIVARHDALVLWQIRLRVLG
jgi:hypothetical protein